MVWWDSDRWSRCTWRNAKTGRRCARPATRVFKVVGHPVSDAWGRCASHAAVEHTLGEGCVLHELAVAEVAAEAEQQQAAAALRLLAQDPTREAAKRADYFTTLPANTAVFWTDNIGRQHVRGPAVALIQP